MTARLEHHQQHAACWMEMELLQQQLKASQEKLLEAKASLSLAQTRHALQLQQVKAQMNNMVPRKHFEELQTSLRAEQCKAQQLQENLHRQAEQTCRQLLRTQSVRISEQGPGEMDSPGLPGNNPLVFVACCRRNMSVSCRQLWIRQRRWSTTSGVLKLCWQREQLSLKMPSPNSPGTTC
ncbi:uncharacterized protein LOC130592511 isoform X2 [Pezoporus wallicus]|uniref:uncharacterized protein LOC130592511 isoform X2 n=1 Tax=Pezoporus wallicus TaxID=35540 RepID=UPI00254E75E2|nr:uncharacterized protein LOC130592511 isoform X2 [Pezoporus wallicus]